MPPFHPRVCGAQAATRMCCKLGRSIDAPAGLSPTMTDAHGDYNIAVYLYQGAPVSPSMYSAGALRHRVIQERRRAGPSRRCRIRRPFCYGLGRTFRHISANSQEARPPADHHSPTPPPSHAPAPCARVTILAARYSLFGPLARSLFTSGLTSVILAYTASGCATGRPAAPAQESPALLPSGAASGVAGGE